MKEGVKREVELPAGVERAVGTLMILLPLLLGLPELGAAGKRWREARQVEQGGPEEKAGQGGWKRQAELGLARLFQAPVCDLPQAGGSGSTLSIWTSLASVPFWGLCLERIPRMAYESIYPNRVLEPGLEAFFCWEISEQM